MVVLQPGWDKGTKLQKLTQELKTKKKPQNILRSEGSWGKGLNPEHFFELSTVQHTGPLYKVSKFKQVSYDWTWIELWRKIYINKVTLSHS